MNAPTYIARRRMLGAAAEAAGRPVAAAPTQPGPASRRVTDLGYSAGEGLLSPADEGPRASYSLSDAFGEV